MSDVVREKIAVEAPPQPRRQLPPKPHSRHGKRNLTISIVAMVLIIVLLGGTIVYLKYFRTSPVQYVQQKAFTGNLSVSVSSTGPLQPKATYNMNFSASGQVQSIDVHIGQQVKAGQALATLNSSSLQDALTSAQHKLSAAQTAYNDAAASGASQSALDADKANVTAAQDAVNTAQDDLNAATLKAPANTTVAAINGMVGQNVGSGSSNSSSSSGSSGSGSSSGSSAFIVLEDTSAYTIAAQVNEADIAQVKVGQPINFTLAAYPNRTFTGTVSDVQGIGQTTSNVVNYTVDMAVNSASLKGTAVFAGMTATVNIITAQANNVLLVPNSALTFYSQALQQGEISRQALRSQFGGSNGFGGNGGTGRNFGGNGSGNGSGNSAGNTTANSNGSNSTAQGKRGMVLELQNGKLVPVLVTLGLTDGQNTEILSGLQAGDSVVVSQIGGNTTTSSSLLNGTNGNFNRRNGAGAGGFGGGTGGFGGGNGSGGGSRSSQGN